MHLLSYDPFPMPPVGQWFSKPSQSSSTLSFFAWGGQHHNHSDAAAVGKERVLLLYLGVTMALWRL